MQRFTSPRILGWISAVILSLPLACPVGSSAQEPSIARFVPAVPFPAASSDCTVLGDRAQFVSTAEPSTALRLPIALVPGRPGRLLKKGTGTTTNSGLVCGSVQPVVEPVPFFSTVPGPVSAADASPSSDASTMALPPRKTPDLAGRTAGTKPERAVMTTATSLAVVVGLFLLLVWFQRRVSGRNGLRLPGAVVQTLGRVPLNGRQEMQLVQVGNKLLLLAVTATSAETLTEITDPAEIARLNGICQHDQPGSISASFREILSQLQQPSSSRPIR
jgi:flagellar biogenesis protein FliO